MYIIAIAWMFVVVLMSAAEAMATSLVGGVLTFVFYGVVPLAILLYILGTPQRRRNQRAARTDPDAPAPGADRGTR